ncbi:MAG: hypothetical protein AAF394_01430 [Planctomycetota bacterium]
MPLSMLSIIIAFDLRSIKEPPDLIVDASKIVRFYQYQLLANWFGGLALAQAKTMDGDALTQPAMVLLRDPMLIFDYQFRGDRGYMFDKTTEGVGTRFYAIQAPCGNNPSPDPTFSGGNAPVGACCLHLGSGEYQCFESTQSDCVGSGGVYKGDSTACGDLTICDT